MIRYTSLAEVGGVVTDADGRRYLSRFASLVKDDFGG